MEKKKKKHIILISIIIATLIAIIIGIIVIIICRNNVNNFDPNYNFEDRVHELFQNNYTYYYFLYGDINVGEGTVESDGITYYIVDDPKVVSLNSFNEIVEDTFMESMINTLLEVENKNEYIDVDGTLYVKKIDNPCTDIVEFDTSKLNYAYSEDKVNIIYGDRNTARVFKENDIWKLEGNLYYCLTDIENQSIEP